MTAFWHPLSTLLIRDPRCFASSAMLGLLLRTGEVELIYCGDRMAPTLGHGARVTARPVSQDEPKAGSVVVALPEGVPDLLRVVAADADSLELTADSDPAPPIRLPRQSVLAVARIEGTVPGPRRRSVRRLLLDHREAWQGRPDDPRDPEGSVRFKYETQAPFYARASGDKLEASLAARIRHSVPESGSILVLGSGAGKECFALAEGGWQVRGVDFAPAMVSAAREEARQREVAVEFDVADLRSLTLPPNSLNAAVFTYDVYSFLPSAADRIRLLETLRQALVPGGLVFLSARRVRSPYQRWILTLQWLRRTPRDPELWGHSHTRWVAMDGTLHRSFVQVFGRSRLEREIGAAGFQSDRWDGGHACLTPRGGLRRVAGRQVFSL